MALASKRRVEIDRVQFKNDRSNDEWKRSRSRRIFQVAQYNWIIMPSFLVIAYTVVYHLFNSSTNRFFYIPDDSLSWTWVQTMWLVLIFPNRPIHLFSVFAACCPLRPFRLSNQPIKRSFTRLLICLVTRGDQEQVVRRSVFAGQDICKKLDERVSFHVLTEEENAEKFRGIFRDHVLIHGVPSSYRTKVAKYKARSLEWFRKNVKLGENDWVLHIDEETIVDEYAIKTCLDFIMRQDEDDIGTGVIHYNEYGYWKHLISTVGDLGRVQGDWGRIQWRSNQLHRVAMGVHGSFLLIRGIVENAVTWETDHVTEDYWFLLNAIDKGFQIGWVPAIARELSPTSVHDYMRQRRRWFTGILTLNQLAGKLALASWIWSLFEPVYFLLCVSLCPMPLRVPRWFYCIAVFDSIYGGVFRFLSVLLQDWDAGLPWTTMIYSEIMAALLGPVTSLIDSYAILTVLLDPEKGFFIITKD